ncbi:MAG: hypothetical protein MUD14_13900 [Hydrococcus sp. Prado102]|nr:hypothetical protein [Hydrococcus sp. Prado102]
MALFPIPLYPKNFKEEQEVYFFVLMPLVKYARMNALKPAIPHSKKWIVATATMTNSRPNK